jgi:hypothetical protein
MRMIGRGRAWVDMLETPVQRWRPVPISIQVQHAS